MYKGAVRGGFDQQVFVRACEQEFARQTGYKRDQRESFDYCHAMKNGGVAAIREQARIRVEQEFQSRQEQGQLGKVEQQQKIKQRPQQSRSHGIGRKGKKYTDRLTSMV
jgi:hypothetical protein